MYQAISKHVVTGFGEIFKRQWGKMGELVKDTRKSLELQLEQLHAQKDRTIDKLIESNHSSVVAACERRIQKIELDIAVAEEKIGNCGRPVGDFDDNFRTAINFLAEPHKLWASDDYQHKRAVLRMGFSEPLVYHRNKGFRTACKSQPFRLVDSIDTKKGGVVDATGLEPVTLAL